MASLSKSRVMVSLLCALAPVVVVACGGGSAESASDSDEMADETAAGAGTTHASKGGSTSTSTSPEASAGATAGKANPGEPPAGEGGAGEIPVAGDTEAPSVILTFPGDGDGGVKHDTIIEIEFNEPMDTASVEAAYVSNDLPAGSAAFSWDAEGTKLTITPNDKLVYETGADPAEVAAKSYALTIASTATDLAGNPMTEDAKFAFTTLREIHASLPPYSLLSGHVDLTSKGHSVTIQAGDTVANTTDRGLISFDLSSIPESYKLVAASLAARQAAPVNHPFEDLSIDAKPAKVTLFDRSFASREEGAGLLPGSSIGPFSTSAEPGPRKLTVLGPVEKDLADRVARNNLTQYALQFAVTSDGKSDTDKVQFVEVALELNYLAP